MKVGVGVTVGIIATVVLAVLIAVLIVIVVRKQKVPSRKDMILLSICTQITGYVSVNCMERV